MFNKKKKYEKILYLACLSTEETKNKEMYLYYTHLFLNKNIYRLEKKDLLSKKKLKIHRYNNNNKPLL